MLYLACHCSVKNPTLNAQRQWSKLPTSRLVESHSSLLCDNLPQRNLCSWKNNRCASKNWFPRIFSRLICTFSQQKRVDLCFFNSFFTSFTCKVVKAATSVPGEDLFCFHQRSSCFHWICSDPKWLEPGMERQPVSQDKFTVFRPENHDGEIPTNYRFWDHITWSRWIDWLLSWSITSRCKWVRSNQIIVSRVQHPWFDFKMFQKLWVPSSRIKSHNHRVNKKSLCQQNCQPHIRCSEASKSSTLLTTSWQDLDDFNVAQIPCGSWEKYDLPISSRPLSYCLVSLGIPPS